MVSEVRVLEKRPAALEASQTLFLRRSVLVAGGRFRAGGAGGDVLGLLVIGTGSRAGRVDVGSVQFHELLH